MGASAGRTSPEPSEQPLKGRVGYFTSESNFALWTHTRHKTILLLPVKEQVWKAIKMPLFGETRSGLSPSTAGGAPCSSQKGVFVHRNES